MNSTNFLSIPNLLRPWLWLTKPIQKQDLNSNPYIEFAKWYKLALNCFWLEFPDAVCLATVDASGRADSRMVLLKGFSPEGFKFFTNYESNKGQQLQNNNTASMTFFWDSLQRQIRLKGSVHKLSGQESDDYFNSRSPGSRVSAAKSMQSKILENPAEFHAQIQQLAQTQIQRPESWGGYILVAEQFEFWKARANRAHDRFLYTKQNGLWQIDQLYP